MRNREEIEEDLERSVGGIKPLHLITEILLDIRDLLKSPPSPPRIQLRKLEVHDKRNRS